MLKSEVLERKKFELLHNEKITPYFLTLVKGSKKEDTLENITKDDGTEFEIPDARKDFIKNSFESLYKIPDDEAVLEHNSSRAGRAKPRGHRCQINCRGKKLARAQTLD